MVIAMKQKPLFLLLACLLPASALAESVLPLDPQAYGMQKPFGPPKPITPKNVLTVTPENQFDFTQRENPNVVNAINDRVDKPFHLTMGQFGDSTYTGALWRQREANYYLVGSLAYTNADDYKDGDGKHINYGYERKGAAVVLGVLPNAVSEHRLTFVYDDIDDDKQPQHKMDPVNTQRTIGKYNLRLGAPDDSNTLHAELSAISVERDANNFDLRALPPSPKTKKILMDVERQKYTGDIHFNRRFNDQHKSTIGLRFQDDTHDAKRFVKTPKGNMQNGYRFPDVKTQTTRLYVAHDWQPSQQHQLQGALSYDWQSAGVRGADKIFVAGKNPKTGKPMKMSSAQLWQKYYGKKLNGDIEQSGLSGKLRYTFSPSDKQDVYGQLESLYRMPENPERFAVLPAPQGMAWAANPWIKPERENRLTLGMNLHGDGWGGYQTTKQDDFASAWQVGGEVYYAKVDDFITLDRYRGKKPPLQGNLISRNVDAKLAGVALKAQKNWTQNLSTALTASYQYGQNTTDDRPLYQVAPFEAGLSVDWKDYFDGGSYSIGSRLRYQGKQHRRDDNPSTGLGIDNATDDFATVDIYGGINWKDRFGVSLGVDNVFDKDYAEYITGSHVESVAPKTINAPGRQFWLRLNTAF